MARVQVKRRHDAAAEAPPGGAELAVEPGVRAAAALVALVCLACRALLPMRAPEAALAAPCRTIIPYHAAPSSRTMRSLAAPCCGMLQHRADACTHRWIFSLLIVIYRGLI